MKRTTSSLLALLLIGMSSTSLAAGGHMEQETVAVQAAQAWLSLVDGSQYVVSWKTAASYFKNAITEAQWQQAMAAVRAPLGAVQSRQLASTQFMTSLPGAPDGEYVVIQYQTSFESKNPQ